MLVKTHELDTHEAGYSTHDETEPTRDLCLANVGVERYQACGKVMRRYRNGVTVCPIHGEMH